jgi:hypothetical protein
MPPSPSGEAEPRQRVARGALNAVRRRLAWEGALSVLRVAMREAAGLIVLTRQREGARHRERGRRRRSRSRARGRSGRRLGLRVLRVSLRRRRLGVSGRRLLLSVARRRGCLRGRRRRVLALNRRLRDGRAGRLRAALGRRAPDEGHEEQRDEARAKKCTHRDLRGFLRRRSIPRLTTTVNRRCARTRRME